MNTKLCDEISISQSWYKFSYIFEYSMIARYNMRTQIESMHQDSKDNMYADKIFSQKFNFIFTEKMTLSNNWKTKRLLNVTFSE